MLSKSDRMDALLQASAKTIAKNEDASHLLSALQAEVDAKSEPVTPPSIAGSLPGRIAAARAGHALVERPSTYSTQRPDTASSQRPGTALSQRTGTALSPRPGTGGTQLSESRPSTSASTRVSRPSTATLLTLGHAAKAPHRENVSPLAEVTNTESEGEPKAELQRTNTKVKGRRHATNARAAQSTIATILTWE